MTQNRFISYNLFFHSPYFNALPLEYAQVIKMLGDGRLSIQCFDGVMRTGLIRGTMRRRVWINTVRIFKSFEIFLNEHNSLQFQSLQGDIILVGLRDFQDDKADVIHKYTTEEARKLQDLKELPLNAKINQTAADMAIDGFDEDEEDMGLKFEDI